MNCRREGGVGREDECGRQSGERWRAQSGCSLASCTSNERIVDTTQAYISTHIMLDKRQYIQPDGKGNGNRVGLCPVITDAWEKATGTLE